MHQGETTGGWHIRRDLESLFDAKSLTIDATRFLRALNGCLSDYRATLKESEWHAEVWKQCRKRIEADLRKRALPACSAAHARR